MNSIQKVRELGQEIWLDYIRRDLLMSGQLRQLVESGISGLTANPTILEKAINDSNYYEEDLKTLIQAGKNAEEIYETLAIQDVSQSAELFRPTFNQTRGRWGFASLEVSPLIADKTEETVAEGQRLFKALASPNAMVKVPATPQGIPAIRRLTAKGINVNVTLIFSLEVYRQVIDAYVAGLEDLVKNGGNPAGVASVASFFLSRIDSLVDSQLEERIKKGESDLQALLGNAAVASAKLAYQIFQESFRSERFTALRAKGARVQRPLWASTGTKNPKYSDVKYVEPLIGKDSVNTLPLATIQAFLDHGRAEDTIERDVDKAAQDLDRLKAVGISIEEVTAKLLTDGVKSFSDSYVRIMTGIAAKKV